MNTRLTIHRSLSTNGDFQRSYTGYENKWRRNVNLKVVLRTYGLLRQLTDDETALLETLRSLTDSDREQLVESLTPAKAAVRKRKPRASRSPRAESLATAISSRALDGGVSKLRCAHVAEGGDDPTACGEYASNPIHDEMAGYSGYHAFEAPEVKASVAAGD
jgi:hypothetical protein